MNWQAFYKSIPSHSTKTGITIFSCYLPLNELKKECLSKIFLALSKKKLTSIISYAMIGYSKTISL